jgi:hypothetical protein
LFFREFLSGNVKLIPLSNPELPAVADVEPWDGKDGVQEVEEEFDLADLMSE